jgi:hypothetical protein
MVGENPEATQASAEESVSLLAGSGGISMGGWPSKGWREHSSPGSGGLAEKGYDPALGARPLRRTIQRMVEDPLSEKLLYKEFQAGQTIIVDARDGDIVFEAAAPPPDIPPVELAGRES